METEIDMELENINEVGKINRYFLITALMGVYSAFFYPFKSDSIALMLVYSQLIFLFPSVMYMLLNKKKYRNTVRFNKIKVGNVFLIILFGILLSPVLTFINALSLVLTSNAVSNTMIGITEQVPWIIGFLLVAIMPAICEETVYRGVLFNEYGKYDILKGALLSGLLFGLMHRNLNQFTYAFFMGVVFALLVEASGSIISTMILHVMINGFSITLMYLYKPLYNFVSSTYESYVDDGNTLGINTIINGFGDVTLPYDEWMTSLMSVSESYTITQVINSYGMMAIICGVLAFFVFKAIAVNAGNWERIKAAFTPKEEKKTWKVLFTLPCIIGILLCIVIMILYEIM